MDETDTSLQVATQIRDMLRSQNELYLAQARLVRGQLAMMEALAEAQGTMTDRVRDGFNSAEEQIAAAEAAMQQFQATGQGAMGAVSGGAVGTADAIDSLADSLIEAGDAAQRLGMGGIILESLEKGFNATKAALGGFSNIIFEVLGGIGDLGTAIFAAVLSPFESLFKQAAMAVSNTDYKRAVEELRGAFGELTTNEGAAVMSMFKGLGRELGDTGLRTRRILGPPAEQLKYMTGLAKSFGAQFNAVFNEGLIENAGNVVAFKKSLDLTDESMRTTARIARTTGRTIDDVLQEQANYAIQLGDAFGISSMVISRGMQEMENDMKHFGGLSKKTLAEVTVYAQQLGIEIKTLSGIMEAFDNFDTASEAAARLNQQFGIQIDTLEMLREEDPAARADMLRQSLNAAGVSYTDLDRRSKSYLATQLHISESEAELLFNRNNQGLSLDQIKKKAGEAEKKQLSQAEIMERLGDAIERIVQQMQQMEEGLFANFFKGFNEGIANSREMRGLLNDVHQIMRDAVIEGRRMGRAFIEAFPGAMDIIQGFRELFNPARWKKMFGDIVSAFRDFFQTIENDPEAGLRTLMERLQTAFFNNFTDGAANGQRLIAGFRRFFTAILRVLLAAVRVIVPTLLNGIRDGLRELNAMITNEGGNVEFAGFFSEITTALGELFNELFNFFDNFMTNYGNEIWEAFKTLAGNIWSRLRPWLEEHWTEVVLGLGAFFAGPALLSALTQGLGALFTNAISRVFEGGLGGVMGGAGAAGAAAGAAAGGARAASGAASTAAAAGSIVESGSGIPFEQLLTNVATILTANNAINDLMDGLFNFAVRVKASNLTLGDVGVAVTALTAAGAMIGAMIVLAERVSQMPDAAAAIAGVEIFLAGILGSAVLTRLQELLDQLFGAGEDGIFRKLRNVIIQFATGDTASPAEQEQYIANMRTGLIFLTASIAVLADLLPIFQSLSSPVSDLVDYAADVAGLGGEEDSGVTTLRTAGDRLEQILLSTIELARIFNRDTAFLSTATDIEARGIVFAAFVLVIKDMVTGLFPPLQELLTSLQENSIDFNQVGTVLQTTFDKVVGFIRQVLESTSTIPVERFSSLVSITPLFAAFGEYLVSFSRVGDTFQGVAAGTPANIDTVVVGNLLDAIAEAIGKMMWASRAFANFTPEQIEAMGSIFEASGGIFGNLNQVSSNLANLTIDSGALAGFVTSAPNFSSALLTMLDIGSSIFNPENLESLNGFANVGPAFTRASEQLVNINQTLLPIATDTTENLRTRVGDLLGTITDTVNAINDIGSVGLVAALDTLENNLGLGTNAAYTIRNQNFNLTINMKVVIDAARFENVFYKRAHETEGGAEEMGGFNTNAFNSSIFDRRGVAVPISSGGE